jgi:hypothetical protein
MIYMAAAFDAAEDAPRMKKETPARVSERERKRELDYERDDESRC